MIPFVLLRLLRLHDQREDLIELAFGGLVAGAKLLFTRQRIDRFGKGWHDVVLQLVMGGERAVERAKILGVFELPRAQIEVEVMVRPEIFVSLLIMLLDSLLHEEARRMHSRR